MTQAELNAIRLHFQQTGSLTKQQATDLLAETGKLINALNFACGVISDLLAEVRRLNEENAEQKKVVDATFLYMKNINSPLCIGWDNLLDAMQSYRKYLESEAADNG